MVGYRPSDLISPSLVLLVEQEGRAGAHWLLSARGVLCDSYTNGQWVAGFPGGDGPDGGWRMREVWRVTPVCARLRERDEARIVRLKRG